MAFLGSLDIVGSALTAERYRSDIILQNMANARTTVTSTGEPYRRKQVIFEERPITFEKALSNAGRKYQSSGGVRVSAVVENQRDFKSVYDPTHPQADENGYVQYSNVDSTEEMVDLMAVSNAYDANLSALAMIKSMINKAIELGK